MKKFALIVLVICSISNAQIQFRETVTISCVTNSGSYIQKLTANAAQENDGGVFVDSQKTPGAWQGIWIYPLSNFQINGLSIQNALTKVLVVTNGKSGAKESITGYGRKIVLEKKDNGNKIVVVTSEYYAENIALNFPIFTERTVDNILISTCTLLSYQKP